jgi:hypothetical protein
MNDHPNDDSTEPDHDTTAGGYTVHHIDEDAAKRAVRRFQAKADRAETGERVAASGTVYIEDALLEEVDDGARYLIDGEPLGSWLAGRVDRMVIEGNE